MCIEDKFNDLMICGPHINFAPLPSQSTHLSSGNGGDVELLGGDTPNTGQPGGNVRVAAGYAGTVEITSQDASTSPSGPTSLSSGSAGHTNQVSGQVSVTSGEAIGSTSGSVVVQSALGKTSGNVRVSTGDASSSHSGDVELSTGSPLLGHKKNGDSGDISLSTSDAGRNGNSGGIKLATGSGKTSGDVEITAASNIAIDLLLYFLIASRQTNSYIVLLYLTQGKNHMHSGHITLNAATSESST